MSTRKPTAGFWITVALVGVPVAYSLSAGPVSWLANRGYLSTGTVEAAFVAYSPLRWLFLHGPQPVNIALQWYIHLWS